VLWEQWQQLLVLLGGDENDLACPLRRSVQFDQGATPVLRTSRVGSAALVAPTSRTPHIQNTSGADISLIRAGYKPDQFSIQH
jgi:hypothetical protein